MSESTKLDGLIARLKLRIAADTLKLRAMENMCGLKIGDTVRGKRNNSKALVTHLRVCSWNDCVHVYGHRQKKDGTPSKTTIELFDFEWNIDIYPDYKNVRMTE